MAVDDRGQSQLLGLVIGVIMLTTMAIVGVLTLWFGGAVLVPFYDNTVGASQAAADAGFATPAYHVLRIGLGLSLPLFIASPVVYYLFLRLRTDTTPGRR